MTMPVAGSIPTDLISHVNGAFTEGELDLIERYADGLTLANAMVRSRILPGEALIEDQYNRIRITKVAEIHKNAATNWVYDRLAQVIVFLSERYRCDLNGHFQAFQYLVYRDSDSAHFGWHVDPVPFVKRKLSLTLQLSAASKYEGCELQFDLEGKIVAAPKTRGTIVVFPSHVRHRVTPIILGTRKSIVAWALGR
jgi:PKHD-type hydroxylase